MSKLMSLTQHALAEGDTGFFHVLQPGAWALTPGEDLAVKLAPRCWIRVRYECSENAEEEPVFVLLLPTAEGAREVPVALPWRLLEFRHPKRASAA